MEAHELRKKYIDFFVSKGHTHIPSASLIPENDPSVLFTTAGMHPLVPYLMGEAHPGGKRVVNVQKCIRTSDIDEVGDNRHLTFFEMMGNWSFGDYFKKEAIEWSWEFLTDPAWLGLDPQRIYVTVFRGEEGIPKDEESVKIWQTIFKQEGLTHEIAKNEKVDDTTRIIPLGKEDNFWIAGATGPCGADTEMFYDTNPQAGPLTGNFSDLVKSGRLIEIWNDVFMEFNKTPENKYVPLKQQNVDTGMGLERTITVLNGFENVFQTEFFQPFFKEIEKLSDKKYSEEENTHAFRIIADHIKTATFILGDPKGLTPSNVDRGYILRRLIRRAVRFGKLLGIKNIFTFKLAEQVIKMYKDTYPELKDNKEFIVNQLSLEEEKFNKTLSQGLKELEKMSKDKNISGKEAFILFTTYGFPFEMTKEIAEENGFKINDKEFNDEFKKHQQLSRTASAGMFKGGLADTSDATKKLHTAAHLMLAALRKVLGAEVYQKGSNITADRLRFDFSYDKKMTPEQIREVEDLVNEKIKEKIPVNCEEMDTEEAKRQGAMGVFGHKYGDKVKVYSVGSFSKEICGGPHVENTGDLGHFKIQKEESSSAGVRRIKAILE
ncbi:alanine--tRNA ligase [Candidatus Falkowbacteria bacterium]|nr:alanine--tRNA ligase [Candidatus Falkowbacteria bacterium]